MAKTFQKVYLRKPRPPSRPHRRLPESSKSTRPQDFLAKVHERRSLLSKNEDITLTCQKDKKGEVKQQKKEKTN